MGAVTIDQLSNSWPQEAIENRLRAIAINAVREARIVFMRDDKPFIDDDARRTELIFQMLHLAAAEHVATESEHYPLVAPIQAPKNERMDKIEKILTERKEKASLAS